MISIKTGYKGKPTCKYLLHILNYIKPLSPYVCKGLQSRLNKKQNLSNRKAAWLIYTQAIKELTYTHRNKDY